ncbi:DDE-type integrase/transposase/recombinase [Pseudonocardia sp. KRD291]|uniref:DDE-type integrase/transposase/recombinase n=1 Tax=Pseudonocardia sp. KRD291 TaxID=2792007 RepID=UPI001C4A4289|nr:DDE-type integrase/transposase/recombinase [Pseudonocardia sp. KRD291]MBW0102961.1 DDE-type integrase/transposase/recombinase [Pseudonocardia sp. KRD291]
MTRLDPQEKTLLVARLRERRRAGELTSDAVRAVGADVGVTERTVWRWLTVAPDATRCAARAGYELTDADLDAFAAWQRNVAAVHRELHADRPDGLSVRRLQYAFATQLTPGQRAGLVEGAEGRRRYEVYLRWEPPARNALWEGDHVELPVLVLAPRAQRPVKPWATLFIDGYSRLVMGWAISLRPTSATVLAALRGGIALDPARGPFGGVPSVLRTDHGLEFTATALRRSCAALGARQQALVPMTRGTELTPAVRPEPAEAADRDALDESSGPDAAEARPSVEESLAEGSAGLRDLRESAHQARIEAAREQPGTARREQERQVQAGYDARAEADQVHTEAERRGQESDREQAPNLEHEIESGYDDDLDYDDY